MIDVPNIAIIGKIGSGKTTLSGLLQEHHSYERMSFAAPLKAGCRTTTDRALLQSVGHGMRELYEDFWVNLFVDSYMKLPERQHRRIVVDDCRYPNEAEVLRGEGFKFIRIVAPRNVRAARSKADGRLQDEAQLDHIGDCSLDEFEPDATIHNNGSHLPDLHDLLVALLNRWRS